METPTLKRDMLLARAFTSIVLLTASAIHFFYTEDLTILFPDFIPIKHGMVYLGGMVELVAAIGLLIPRYRITTAWMLIGFFAVVLPVNICAGIRHIISPNLIQGNLSIGFLWLRIPVQCLCILWIYHSCIKTSGDDVGVEALGQAG